MEKTLWQDNFIENAVEEYLNMVLRIAYQNLQNQSDAEDIAQEVFLRLMKQKLFQDKDHMKAWLIRVTINLCKDFKKSAWNRKTQRLNEEWVPFTQEQTELLQEIWKLPKQDRNIIYLYYYEEFTTPEIADILNEKINTISSRLTRARKKLKDILIEGGYQNA